VHGGKVGDVGMRERSVWRTLSCMSTPWDMQSFIVWMLEGTAERETARREMRRWREPRAMVITSAFFVAQPMKTGRRSSSVCQPSVVRGRQSRGEVEEGKHIPKVKLAVTT
jgi:hypothetical protein